MPDTNYSPQRPTRPAKRQIELKPNTSDDYPPHQVSYNQCYSIDGMSWGIVELEPEVRDWLKGLSTAHFATAAFYIDLLADEGPLLSEPYSRQLDGKLRELRFHLEGAAVRVTYWMIILLTAFRKTRMREAREIARARRAWQRCIAEEHRVDGE